MLSYYSHKFTKTYWLVDGCTVEELQTLENDCETEEEFIAFLRAEEAFYHESLSGNQLPLLPS